MLKVNRSRFRDALRQGMSLDAAFGYAEAAEAHQTGKGHPLDRRLLRDTIKNSVREGGMPHEVLFRAMSKKLGDKVANVADDDMGGASVNELSDVGGDPGMISKDELFFQGPSGKSSRFLMGDRKRWVRDALGSSPKNITPTLSGKPPAAPKMPAGQTAPTAPPAAPATPAAPAAPKPASPTPPAKPTEPVGRMTGKEVAGHPVAKAIRGVATVANWANEQRLAAGRQAAGHDAARRQPDGTFRSGDMTPDTADGVKAFVDRRRRVRDLLPMKEAWKPTPDPAHGDPAGMYSGGSNGGHILGDPAGQSHNRLGSNSKTDG